MSIEDDDLRSQALYEAAAWRIQLSEHRVETTPGFEAWRSVAENAEAWDQMQAIWTALESVGSHPQVVAYRKAARRRRPARPASVLLVGALAASLAVLLMAPAVRSGIEPWRAIDTAPAVRRIVALEDGTRVTLDASSRLRVKLHGDEREVELLAGQARFDVAHDPRRPFRVHADGRVVTALGTSFTIDRTKTATVVTLIRGRISVATEPPFWRPAALAQAPRPTYLAPGQRLSLVAAASDSARLQPVSIKEATAWETGRLVFDDEPLARAVERVGRYSDRPIVIEDPHTARLRISGVFDAGDAPGFVEAVTQYYGLEAGAGRRGEIVIRRAREK